METIPGIRKRRTFTPPPISKTFVNDKCSLMIIVVVGFNVMLNRYRNAYLHYLRPLNPGYVPTDEELLEDAADPSGAFIKAADYVIVNKLNMFPK